MLLDLLDLDCGVKKKAHPKSDSVLCVRNSLYWYSASILTEWLSLRDCECVQVIVYSESRGTDVSLYPNLDNRWVGVASFICDTYSQSVLLGRVSREIATNSDLTSCCDGEIYLQGRMIDYKAMDGWRKICSWMGSANHWVGLFLARFPMWLYFVLGQLVRS